jgi:hypothetical protein
VSKRQRCRITREQRYPGVDWLPKPVTLAPATTIRVLGVTKDSPDSLWKWWLRESHQRGIEEAA